jgi:hypothetical protein
MKVGGVFMPDLKIGYQRKLKALKIAIGFYILVVLLLIPLCKEFGLKLTSYLFIEGASLVSVLLASFFAFYIFRWDIHRAKLERDVHFDVLWLVLGICFFTMAYEEMEFWVWAAPRILIATALIPVGTYLFLRTIKEFHYYLTLYLGMGMLISALILDIVRDAGTHLFVGDSILEEMLELTASLSFLYLAMSKFIKIESIDMDEEVQTIGSLSR